METPDHDPLYAETLDPAERRSTRAGGTPRLALTLAHHPDVRRLGERAVVPTGGCDVGRVGPEFSGGPIADPYLSRRCLQITVPGRGARLVPLKPGAATVDGRALTEPLELTAAQLDSGVLLQLQKRVLVIVRRSVGPEGPPRYGLLGWSDAVRRAHDEIERVASRDLPVLIRGESGTGKELVARAVHASSARRSGPWVAVNMAGMAPSIASSELFGHKRGAFTGAAADQPGYFGRAHGGTLFLDEVGDAPLDVQLMLLRAIETGEIHPVGAARPTRVDVRLVAATDQSLEQAVAEGRFRAQLYHRLASYQIELPPLRERPEDIPALLRHFLETELGASGPLSGGAAPDRSWLPLELSSRLLTHHWPGNVRELRNVVRQLVVASDGASRARVSPALERLLRQPPAQPREATPPTTAPAALDDDTVRAALRRNGFAIRAAAQDLGISKTALYELLDERPGFRKATDLSRQELEAARDRLGGDIKALSAHFEVSVAALRRRLTELSL